jgi:hypothetical protein
MRLSLIAGIVLLVAGAVLLVRGGTFTSRREVLDIGGLRVSADERHSTEPWMAGLALVAGTLLVVSAIRRKS